MRFFVVQKTSSPTNRYERNIRAKTSNLVLAVFGQRKSVRHISASLIRRSAHQIVAKNCKIRMTNNRKLRADNLLVGMSVMLIMTVVQRLIGFARGIWFCRLLDDATLGQWAMGYGFVSLVTPMFLLGLPGSLPRFVEYYNQRGQLRAFLRQMIGVTAAVGCLSLSIPLMFPQFFAGFVFGDDSAVYLVTSLAVAVFTVILFNTTNQLIGSLRLVRVASFMQFVQSVVFTVVAVLWLWNGGGMSGVLLAFAGSTLLATLPAWYVLVRGWNEFSVSSEPLPSAAMWRRILPYAVALWFMNLLSNTFELTDRYMLLHLSPDGPAVGQRLVGQYHSSLFIPSLMISLATMLASVIMPYLVADWEKGRRRAMGEKLRQILIGASVAFTATAIVALTFSQWIFTDLLAGRYDSGLSVLPVVLVFCIWCALVSIAQNYLWVVEKGRLAGYVLLAGVSANFLLNYLLIPRIGLVGAVWGTLTSHAVVLVGIWWANAKCGFRMDLSIFWISVLPATLLAGPVAAFICLVATLVSSNHCRRYLQQLGALAGCQIRGLAR